MHESPEGLLSLKTFGQTMSLCASDWQLNWLLLRVTSKSFDALTMHTRRFVVAMFLRKPVCQASQACLTPVTKALPLAEAFMILCQACASYPQTK